MAREPPQAVSSLREKNHAHASRDHNMSLALAAPAFAQAPGRRRGLSEGVRELPPAAGARFARADARGARHDRARGDSHGAHERQHVPAGIGADRRRAPGRRRRSLPAGRWAPRRRCRQSAAARRSRPALSARGSRNRLERVGRRRREHALLTGRQRRPHRGDGAAPEAEVGVRLRRRELRALAAGGRSAAACSSGARAATCSRSTRRPAARTGAITRRPASARR